MNRKGMISIIDAIIFVSILSMVSVAMFSLADTDAHTENQMAGDIVDTFLSMELRSCDVMGTDDTATYPISILLASLINSDDPYALEFVEGIFDGMIQEPYGYELMIEYDGRTIETGTLLNDISSKYRTSVPIVNDKCLTISLSIG